MAHLKNYTLIILNNYFFSTVKSVPRTRLSFMLYVRGLCCRYIRALLIATYCRLSCLIGLH